MTGTVRTGKRPILLWLYREVPDNGNFIAVGKLVAFEAIPPDLLRQFILVYLSEAGVDQKLGMIGQRKDLLDAQQTGLLQAALNQPPADTLALIRG